MTNHREKVIAAAARLAAARQDAEAAERELDDLLGASEAPPKPSRAKAEPKPKLSARAKAEPKKPSGGGAQSELVFGVVDGDQDRAWTAADVVEALGGRAPTAVSTILSQLVSAGRINRVARGAYAGTRYSQKDKAEVADLAKSVAANADKVLEALEDGPLSPQEIVAKTGLSDNAAWACVSKLRAARRITGDESGGGRLRIAT